MKIVSIFMYAVLLLAVLLGVAMFLLPGSGLIGGSQIKIVQSGSMEPAIHTGSIVFLAPKSSYGVGDVITFESSGNDVPTTHRIMEVKVDDNGATWFLTKGDANENLDVAPVAVEDVLGVVRFTVPYLGFLFDFARTKLGFALLIGVPALLIVIDEIDKIYRELRSYRRRKSIEEEPLKNNSKSSHAPRTITIPARMVATKEVPIMMPIERVTPRSLRLVDMRRAPLPVRYQIPVVRATAERPAVPFTISLRVMGQRVVAPVFVAVLVGVAALLSFSENTISYFNDTEWSRDNSLSAVAVGFLIEPDTHIIEAGDRELGTPEGVVETTVSMEAGSIPLQYDLTVSYATGTIALCNAVVASTNDLGAPYEGSLFGVAATGVVLPEMWSLAVDVGDGEYTPGDVCVVDLHYGGWNSSQTTAIAYGDMEVVQLTIMAPALTEARLTGFVETVSAPEVITEEEASQDEGSADEEVQSENEVTETSVTELAEPALEEVSGDEESDFEPEVEEGESEQALPEPADAPVENVPAL